MNESKNSPQSIPDKKRQAFERWENEGGKPLEVNENDPKKLPKKEDKKKIDKPKFSQFKN